MPSGVPYKPRKKFQLVCKACEGKFEATRSDARYCSNTCNQQVLRACRKVRRASKPVAFTLKEKLEKLKAEYEASGE